MELSSAIVLVKIVKNEQSRNVARYTEIVMWPFSIILKFIYSEKATKFYEIFTLLLTGTTYDKINVKSSQTFMAFSEYMNFNFMNLRFLIGGQDFDHFWQPTYLNVDEK